MPSKEEIIAQFNPNNPGITGQLFGLPFNEDNAEIIIVPVPWEVTVSYKGGTANGPQAILEASAQVDLFVKDIPDAWKLGIAMLPFPEKVMHESDALRKLAEKHIEKLEAGDEAGDKASLDKVNEACESLTIYTKSTVKKYLDANKLVGILGGDHSTPLGYIHALGEKHEFGILQIDAHADLRKSYEGFRYSHASIMYNALKIPAVRKLVQVGIRDYCEEEQQVMDRSKGRIKVFFDEDIKHAQYHGESWANICKQIVSELPDLVYISFDIDGLDPKLCPHTGTPVAGGFEYHQITLLLKTLAQSGKKIIGFDLNEVAPGESDEWDANVGARLLFQLCNTMAVSQGKLHYDR
ncbi:MAG: agmatinase family protein [Cyclobacteriaceae bacterium]|nr:agmatinase family protein [Cyclobacteriaceae bacterium]